MYSPAEEKNFFHVSKQFISDGVQPEDLEMLRQVLRFHEWKYYVQDDPVISDFEYDQLFDLLKMGEEQNPALITPDSPTQRVANDMGTEEENVQHITPMLSLANSYNEEDLLDFDRQIKKLLNIDEDENVEYSVEPKFDGGSIALIYENDKLVRAATRGNGFSGEEMTKNARVIRSIPLSAAFSKMGLYKVELRGEALIRKDNFLKINQKREDDGLSLFANPRNAATGGLRMKDPKETAERSLDLFVFQLAYGADRSDANLLDSRFSTHSEMMHYLSSLGFKIPIQEMKTCSNINDVVEFCGEWAEKRDSYPFEIDGMVVKLNRLDYQERCGFTQHHPRWAIAYKFKAKQATSVLKQVEFQIGKIGSITPVAKIQPVSLAGVTVSSISLHNEDFINSKDIQIGDHVLVERAGDVIPYIVKSFPDLRTGEEKPIEFPAQCPSCGTKLIRSGEEAAWRCPNYGCTAQILQRLIFHVSKDAMDIDGFGRSYIERFYDLGWIRNMADIYRLDYSAIAGLEGFGDRSAQNLKSAIEKAKSNPIHRLLHSLSIHHLGKKASKLIAEHIENVMELKNWQYEDFIQIKDIGPVVAENVIQYFSDPQNLAVLIEMEALGVNFKQTEEDKPLSIADDAPLKSKTILFTGTLTKMGRKEAQELAEKAGAKNISAVSGNLDILVVGEKAGSKLKKAEALGTIEIMTEDEFLKLIRNE